MTQEQMNQCCRLGFNWWQDTEGLNDYDFIIVVNSEGNFSVANLVEVKYIAQHDILFWAHPHKLSNYSLGYARNKMNYIDQRYLREYLERQKIESK